MNETVKRRKGNVAVVLKKEIIDILRDRRALFTGLLLPIILYPLLFGFMNNVMGDMINPGDTKAIPVSIVGTAEDYDLLTKQVFVGLKFDFTGPFNELTEENTVELCAVVTHTDGKRNVTLVFDADKMQASTNVYTLINLLDTYNQTAVDSALAEVGLTIEGLKPIPHVATTDRKAYLGIEETGMQSMMLSMLVPMMIVIFLSVGGMTVAMDLFAGEKERHTMEALLCTHAGRNDILVGKFLAVTFYSLAAAVSSVIGLVITTFTSPQMMGMNQTADLTDAASSGFSIAPLTAVLLIGIILLMAMLFSALHVVISCWSRTVKEAGTYSSFIMIASYVPVFASMMMSAGDFTLATAMIPVFNAVGAIKIVLAGTPNYAYFGVTLAACAAFLGIALAATRAMFRNENIILR